MNADSNFDVCIQSDVQVVVSNDARGGQADDIPALIGRAGSRSRSMFQTGFIGLLLWLFLSPSSFPQSLDVRPYETTEDLFAALVKANDPKAATVQSLLDQNSSHLTSAFVDSLMTKAARAYYQQGAAQALLVYGIAIEVSMRLKDPQRIANAHYYRGRTYAAAGNSEAAIASYRASIQIYDQAGFLKDVVYVLGDLGALYLYLQDYKQAREFAERSLRLAVNAHAGTVPAGAQPIEYGLAVAESTLGGIDEFDGKYSSAARRFQRSLKLFETLDGGSRKYGFQILDTMASIGRVSNAMGENGQALVTLHQALALSERLPYVDRTASIFNSLGMLYLEQEDHEKAAHYFAESLRINQTLKSAFESSRNLLNLGVVKQRQGALDQALEHFKASLRQATETSNQDVIIAAGEGIGTIHRLKGHYAEALAALDQALSLATAREDQTRIAELLWRKAEVFVAMQDFEPAIHLSKQVLQLARRIQFSNLSYLAATLLGDCYLRQKQYDLAFDTLTEAIAESERMRHRVVGREQGQQLYFENKVAAYHAMVALGAERGRSLDALRYAEQAKARVLGEILQRRRPALAKSMSEIEQQEERRLNQAIVDLNNQIRKERGKANPDDARIAGMQEQLVQARLQYGSYQNLLSASHSTEIAPSLNDFGFDEILQGLPRDPRTAFLEFTVADDRVYLFVLTRNRSDQNIEIAIHPLPIARNALFELTRKFHHMTTTRNFAFRSVARDFYNLLLKPAEAQLRGKDTLCIIPDGILWEAPFQAALTASRRYLIEDYAIYYAPSLRVLAEMTGRKRTTPSKGLLAIGNPIDQQAGVFESLPEAEREVKAIAKMFNREHRLLLGGDADEKAIRAMAPAYGTIHFATHGVLDNRNPLYSYLYVANQTADPAEDGLIEAREIMNLPLSADLVVLSACETARGRIGAGEGVIGMSWAFLAAGSRTTVVSQWKVDSAMTESLMIGFYRQIKQGKTKAEALRQAAIRLIREGRYDEPIYWAGFVVIGANE